MRTRLFLPFRRSRRTWAGPAAAVVTVAAALLLVGGVSAAQAHETAGADH
jgi:hypothetical protein